VSSGWRTAALGLVAVLLGISARGRRAAILGDMAKQNCWRWPPCAGSTPSGWCWRHSTEPVRDGGGVRGGRRCPCEPSPSAAVAVARRCGIACFSARCGVTHSLAELRAHKRDRADRQPQPDRTAVRNRVIAFAVVSMFNCRGPPIGTRLLRLRNRATEPSDPNWRPLGDPDGCRRVGADVLVNRQPSRAAARHGLLTGRGLINWAGLTVRYP
jgi:hypothetical protein